jgi:hypothetical protein
MSSITKCAAEAKIFLKATTTRLLHAGSKVITTARKKSEQVGLEIFVEADVSRAD